ncbi:MAG: hypothetical protein L0Y71_09650 [Gemmataceae bacterium]|nr:hypothetical protein [Gemmataceae bacterium]
MTILSFIACTLALAQTPTERARHPLAPSLPILTEAEIARYEAVVERFIQYDIGKLPKAQGEKAKADFMRLGPDAIFVLVEGLNRAANMEHSCPAVVIGKKIASIIRTTDDVALLSFIKDTVGSGVKARRHMGVIKDLQVTCILRKGYLQQQRLAAGNAPRPVVSPPRPDAPPNASLNSSFAKFTPADFLAAAKDAQGPKLKSILAEADKRKLFDVLVIAAARPETEAKEIGESFLDKHLEQKTGRQLKDLLKHAKPEARAGAAKAIAKRGLHYEKELIGALADDYVIVHEAAHRALVQFANGKDFGPTAGATPSERVEAVRRWRAWLAASGN